MAFSGTAIITKVTESKFRITGLSLTGNGQGTISLEGGTGEVQLDAPEWGEYKTSGVQGGNIDLASSVQCTVAPADEGAFPSTGAQIPAIIKSGTEPADFLLTVLGRGTTTDTSGLLEIYIQFA